MFVSSLSGAVRWQCEKWRASTSQTSRTMTAEEIHQDIGELKVCMERVASHSCVHGFLEETTEGHRCGGLATLGFFFGFAPVFCANSEWD
eukprot:577007-Pyramimonas_sp.AAC.1